MQLCRNRRLQSGLWFFLFWAGAFLQISGAEEKPVSGDVRSGNGFYSVVFYYAEKAPESAVETVKGLAVKMLPDIPVVLNPDKETKVPFIGVMEENAPLQRLPVPEAAYFEFAGRGLSESDIAAMQKTPRATEIFLVVSAGDVWKYSRLFTALALQYAETTQAYLWDSATRECFSQKAWKESRLDTWPEGEAIPELQKHFTIHLYRPDDKSLYLRAVTLGMEKFALPDVVIDSLIASNNRTAGNLINLTCQYLTENPVVADGAVFEMDLGQVKNEKIRRRFHEILEKGATGKIRVVLSEGKRQEGDPENRLFELGFGNYPGESKDERREKALSSLWGVSDSIKGIKHDEEILAASKRARERLPELRQLILKGLQPGERLLLKAPFPRDDEGNEWMWFEVMEWKEEDQIQGILQNEPFYIKKLKAGMPVTVKTAEIFDYSLTKSDGTKEGNETGKLIEQRQGEVKTK